MAIYALNLFDLRDKAEYLAYMSRAAEGAAKHGGRVVAVGKFSASPVGDVAPREVMLLVEWPSRDNINQYLQDPEYAHLHAHREKGTENYVWHLFEKLTDFAAFLKS